MSIVWTVTFVSVIYLHYHIVNVVKFFTVKVMITKSRYSTYQSISLNELVYLLLLNK